MTTPSRRGHRLGLLAGALLLLNGCASGGYSPMGDALMGWVPGGETDGERAESLPYASLSLDAGDRRGLVVLGAVAGPATYWPTGNQGMLVLYQDGLQATAGLPSNLLESHYLPLTIPGEAEPAPPDYVPWQSLRPGPFRLERRWEDADGLPRQLAARGELRCESPESRELPMGPRTVQHCIQLLEWEDGSRTRDILWRDAETLRLWAVETRPWPGGPRISWQVARAWW
ncbi:hypothetical protein [Halomonas sp. RA08-2]|uniref:hypothetical protein n=1 Tax=Halomonas sp. RA08-2 TaxID=3440842 RepID=UPI003EEF9502